jgi:uracil-DNA glycosylase family 4
MEGVSHDCENQFPPIFLPAKINARLKLVGSQIGLQSNLDGAKLADNADNLHHSQRNVATTTGIRQLSSYILWARMKDAATCCGRFRAGGPMRGDTLTILEREITSCRKCPRLVPYREEVARTKRRAYRACTYWGRPVPAFGDPEARLVIIGLAPGAHGAHRTGRMFTGDRSGDFLYEQLYRAGFANQPQSKRADDGLILKDALISAAIRCAPPANKPLPEEIRNCLPYLEQELALIRPRAILALGGIALNTYLDLLKRQGRIASRAAFPFSHGASFDLPGELPRLFAAYHPSQQNTQTGRLTPTMFARVLRQIRRFLD